jgi:hypothetical protein
VGIKGKQHSAEFKARVAMTALSGEKTLAELSAQFAVDPTMIRNWKLELVKRASELSHRLQYFLRRDIGREDLTPVGVARQYLQCAIEIVVARRDTG